MKTTIVTVGCTICVILIWYENALAYIDPSSGSYFLQLLLASLLGALFALKVFWRRVRAFFARLFSRNRDRSGLD